MNPVFLSKFLSGGSPLLIAIATLLACPLAAFSEPPPDYPDAYNVVWTTPSQNASESMPCGGGDIGLNVWVEKGEVLFYLSRSGAFDENNLFPKLGRVRLKLSPNPFANGRFRQELKLREGLVEIEGGEGDSRATLRLWVDVEKPVVHVNIESAKPTNLEAIYENWRINERSLANTEERHAMLSFQDAPVSPVIHPDTVAFAGNGVTWYHRNKNSLAFDMTVEQQGLAAVKDKLWNPLRGLTFGGRMFGKGLKPAAEGRGRYASTDFNSWTLKSEKPETKHDVQIVLHIATTENIAQWQEGLDSLEKQALANPSTDEAESRSWWDAFWKRSYIVVQPGPPRPDSAEWRVGRNYQLFRYQLACNAKGDYPTKFNGGLFTFDPEYVNPKFPYTPDYRRWGGGSFTAQNQRLVYWPMLKSGDFDMLPSQLNYYARLRQNAEIRSEAYWGIKGASFTEHLENFGLPIAYVWDWKRPPTAPVGVESNDWLEYQWDTVFEFGQMALDLHRYTGADISSYLPFIDSSLVFYDEYYRQGALARGTKPLDEAGKLILYPGTACETYKMAYNPSSTIAALQTVLRSLLELPETATTPEQRNRWTAMANSIPAISFREVKGRKTIAPAIVWSRINNIEIPQLYPVFPWGIYGVGKPDLQVAIDTWRHGVDRPSQRGFVSWHQDNIFCARLGLTDEAAALTLKKLGDSDRRFPTFWGPGHDWVPDHNWGGSGMIGLQEMLLQIDGQKILLFPAWPKTWDVSFKLHAPHGTTVKAELRGGEIIQLQVTPQERTKDLEVLLPVKKP